MITKITNRIAVYYIKSMREEYVISRGTCSFDESYEYGVDEIDTNIKKILERVL